MIPELPPFGNASVLVIGDAMLDRYWNGQTARISPEAPVPVVSIDGEDERPGGAGNVAVNLATLGVRTRLLAVAGDDAEADTLERLLTRYGVAGELLRAKGRRTTTKLRVVSRNQQLIRLDFDQPAPEAMAASLVERATAMIRDVDAVVLSDYGKGTLAGIGELIRVARGAGIPVLVDPKGHDFERYRGASVLTPNRAEFEAVAGGCAGDAELEARAREFCTHLALEHLLVTRSDEGMSLFSGGQALHLAANTREVYDVTGAGDTVIAVLAAGIAAGLDVAGSARLANTAAGVVVGKLGAAPVTPAELTLALHASRGGSGMLDAGVLRQRVEAARAAGERIVMTNGCFDILHPGHVDYLAEARRLGDRLVVAVNDDASVRRLKGAGRPVNPLEHRMAVLAALAAVDWVVPFSTDTPEPLICEILPDVLVKGGDYTPGDIAGARCVQENGGEVRVLPFREGYSTSHTIDAIRDNKS